VEVLKPLSADTTRILRQLLATIAYRASRSLRDAPEGFESARLPGDGKSAAELLHHMTNVLAFAHATVTATDRVKHEPIAWPGEIDRFYSLLGDLDSKLSAGASLAPGMDLKLVQGPLADVLTHIGQLHGMRRSAGSPIEATNYIKAEIHIGCTSLMEQPQ
jgi:hypothetical protein